MDGGRLARIVFNKIFNNTIKATRLVNIVGIPLALALFVLAVYSSNFILGIIALIMPLAGTYELSELKHKKKAKLYLEAAYAAKNHDYETQERISNELHSDGTSDIIKNYFYIEPDYKLDYIIEVLESDLEGYKKTGEFLKFAIFFHKSVNEKLKTLHKMINEDFADGVYYRTRLCIDNLQHRAYRKELEEILDKRGYMTRYAPFIN